MKDLIAIQQKLVPDLLAQMKKRYQILQQIYFAQPIGRRSLAQNLNTTERILRTEVEFLKEQGLVFVENIGMRLTEEGRQLIEELDTFMRDTEGILALEGRLAQILGIPIVHIVPGNTDEDALTKRALAAAAARFIRKVLQPGDVIAVTGGTTIAAIAEMMPSIHLPFTVEVVPARGGIGENVEFQANTIASRLAQKLGGTYRMLHAPDNLSEEAYHSLLADPSVQESLAHIRQARLVVHGIGQAMVMAERRNTSEDVKRLLRENGAVAEAFGYYFNADGSIVYAMNSLGLRLGDLESVETIIGVAGGESKAEAVFSVAKGTRQDVLITDEACAKRILAICS
ncbi:central glycolytic genes regulator [Collibacillus ludicampi]|jgi:central glycolytic genes regulator|uniref:Central glycolytic genes regulator n=1 Tax=Collibacillus ludicampi TaxID=2771369 RepID=A0AAV4LBN6_9BACL|nr:sugar-binding domain-containing protein [Collibacillus ludicampi]GIM45262.1 central glycolytic genes regulator [Collibacillus ludicampi]